MSKPSTPNRSKLKGATLHESTTQQLDFGFVFIGLYLLIHFIPNLESVDVIGPQWLALGLLNFITTAYLLFRLNLYSLPINKILQLSLFVIYILFFSWALFSYFYALNKPEVLIAVSRVFNTFLSFINLSALLYNDKKKFRYASYFILFILFYECSTTIKTFFSGLYETKFDDLIMSLKGNTGNKNIMAAAIAIKLPFTLYIFYTTRSVKKSITVILLFIAFFSIMILNARTTYVSTLFLLFLYIIYNIYTFKKKTQTFNVLIYNLLGVLIPIIFSIVLSQLVVKNALESQESGSGYGTVTDRMESIGFSEQNSGRTGFWIPTISYIKSHPIVGGGVGNWKIYSIPFVRETTNELIVPYHVHNDFLEVTADLGIFGGILFTLLFGIPVYYVFKISKSQADNTKKAQSIFVFFALSVYFFDAFLNFPAERPATQILFALILASITAAYLSNGEQQNKRTKYWLAPVYIYTALVLLVPATYISYLTYKSMKGQMILMRETNSEAKEPLENIANIFPSIPNISVTTLPLQSMKARYYMRDKRYDEAIKLLDEGSKANPYIYYSEFLKAALYFSIDKMDSAYKYGKMSFYNWPRASNYFRNYVAILGRLKDTAEIKNAFSTYVKYRNEAFAWNTYLMGMLQSKGRGNPQLLMMADSALKLFPADSNLIQRRKEILGTFSTSGAAVTEDLVKQANVYYQEGAQLFAKQAYVAAAQKFIKAASLTPGNYAFYENAGLCFYANRQFDKAVQQFDKAIALGTSVTGKSEYFKGVSLVNLGRKEEGCAFVNTAKARNYPDAAAFLSSNCK